MTLHQARLDGVRIDRVPHQPLRHPLALTVGAALLALAVAPVQAQAQFFSSSGAVSTAPVNYFPFDPFASVLDFTGSSLFVGNSAPGSFAAMAGGLLKADGLFIGTGGNGSGTVDVRGAGTRVELGGSVNRLEVGSWGNGSMTVSSGAVVDATVNAAACGAPGASCYNFVGNGAGSTAALTITGSGSEVRALRGFGVGQVAVFGPPTDTFPFGTPGGTTRGSVDVRDGGLLRTEAARVGVGPETAAALGTERGFGSVTIDGAGSRWLVGPNSIDNVAAGIVVGAKVGGDGTLTVANGGALVIDGTGGAGPYDYLNVGANGGVGRLTVTGVGSRIEVKGNNGLIQLGRSDAGGNRSGQGSFSVLAGASASAMFLNVGRDGATGTLIVDGAGSQLTLAGVGTPGVAGAAFAHIGREGGTGSVTVSNGGVWRIGDGGADSRAANTSPGIAIGRGTGGRGALTITGAGSTVEITSTSQLPAAGVADNTNPFVALGYDPGSTGLLTITDGGRLVLTGSALSTPENQRGTDLLIGGRSSTSSGNGSATVSGNGSEIVVGGVDAFIGIGRGPGAIGSLAVSNQARVASTNLVVGESGGSGQLVLDNGRLALSGFRAGDVDTGAGMTVGRGSGGTGTMALANGARVTIDNDRYAGGFNVGGDGFVAGGTGLVTLAGGSSVEIGGAVAGGAVTIGRTGVGVMSLSGASTVDVGAARSVFIGRETTGIGKLALAGGSTLRAGYVGVGSLAGGVDVGTATLTVNDSSVTAATVEIGSRGLLAGDEGTINGQVINGGTIGPGESPGRIIINGGITTRDSGKLVLEVGLAEDGSLRRSAAAVPSMYAVDQIVLTAGSNYDFTGVTVIFSFLDGVNPNAFAATGAFDMDSFLQSRAGGVDTGLSSVFAPGTTWRDVLDDASFAAVSNDYDISRLALQPGGTFSFVAVPVPEPATWALCLAGLGMVMIRSRRRRGEGARCTSTLQPRAFSNACM